ncbi:MAG: DNA-directed RNA polymerase subunit omega [Acidobacteria bacterium]|nr:MAG: DNA-directed RNA polymerase subunit omega [Acidobacteriota bacterium]
MDQLPEKIDSKFRFVLLAAQRAEQMMRGARPRIESKHRKVTRIAMEEILSGAVEWDYGPPEPELLDDELEELAAEEAALIGD